MERLRRIALVGDVTRRAHHIGRCLWELGGYEVATIDCRSNIAVELSAMAPTHTIVDLHRQGLCVFNTVRDVAPQLAGPMVLVLDTIDRQLSRIAAQSGLLPIVAAPGTNESLRAKVLQIARYLGRLAECWHDEALHQRRLEEIVALEKAKAAIMLHFGLTEPQAYTLLRKTAMNTQRTIVQVAVGVIGKERPSPPARPRTLH